MKEKISSKKKKIVVLSCMLALLVVTGFLNITLNNTNTSAINASNNLETVSSQSFFNSYRTERDTARNQEYLYYQVILDSANASDSAKMSAETSLAQLASIKEKELLLEGYIKSKGFEDAVVSFTENFVNVMVSAETLTEAEVAQIVQVVQEQTSKSIDNIKIIPV
ncbi:MAG: SpoIIIAH-like family protein [Clostridia bacterium]|nr:SpoIIIAH-like family protein [Clostridia bacterium]